MGNAAEFLDEPAMKSEIRTQHLGDREREMPVRHGRKDGLGQQRAEDLHLFLVAAGAEPAALARERQQILMGAVIAAHAGEAVGKIPAAHELADDLRDDRSQEPEIVLVGLGVDVQERVKMRVQALPEQGEFRPAGTVCLSLHTRYDKKQGVPNNGIPSKIN